MMQASHRAKGIKSFLNPDGLKQEITKKDHGDEWQFIMSLHINDLVSIDKGNDKREFYRVQKLDIQNNKFVLRLHNASTLQNKQEELNIFINSESFRNQDVRLHSINAIGIITK